MTIADLGSQAIIINEISKAFPNDVIVGEEDSAQLRSNPDLINALDHILAGFTPDHICSLIDRGNDSGGPSKRFWTLDPIDGRECNALTHRDKGISQRRSICDLFGADRRWNAKSFSHGSTKPAMAYAGL